jgi:hypothetical protein
MPPSADDSLPRPIWKPSRTGTAQIEKPLYCGGPNYAALYFKEQREAEERAAAEREQAEREQAERERATKARAKRGRHHADDEDHIASETEKRNDRYAMKLLSQDDDAWGGRSAGYGDLG